MSNKEMVTEKRLKVRLYLSLLVYTVVGYGLTLILDYIFSKFDNGVDRKSTRLNSSHSGESRMPSSA